MRRGALALAVTALLIAVPAALAAGTLTGTYKTTIKGSTTLGGALNGTWKIKLRTGHYKVYRDGRFEVGGTDKMTGNVVTLKDKSGPAKCSGTGKYKFKLTGNKLKFTKISDPAPSCVGRVDVLKHTFTKV